MIAENFNAVLLLIMQPEKNKVCMQIAYIFEMISDMREPLLMLRLCEKNHTFLNAETHRPTVRHWFIHMIMNCN